MLFIFLLQIDLKYRTTMIVIRKLNVFTVFFISLLFGFTISKRTCKRKIFITEDTSQRHCYNETDSKNVTCGSLQEALMTQALNNSCVYLGNNTVLNETINKEYVINLQIFSKNEQSITVQCERSSLSFYHSSGITFSNVNFKDCGYETEILWNEHNLNISMALLFYQLSLIHI